MIQTVKQGLEAEGVTVPITKLCQWFEVPQAKAHQERAEGAGVLRDAN